MRHTAISLLFSCLILCSCSYKQFHAASTGSSIGGMLGSSVGGLMNGHRGSQIGTIVGITAGAAVGLAVTTERNKSKNEHTEGHDGNGDDGIEYETYTSSPASRQGRPVEENELTIGSLTFADANNNHCLEAGEHALIKMEAYNSTQHTLYNITPYITCDNRRVTITPMAVVDRLEPGQGFRYLAGISASSKLKSGECRFQIKFDKQQPPVKVLRIKTQQ